MEGQDDGVAEQSQQHELQSILSCSDRDFLIRNDDDQVIGLLCFRCVYL